MEKARSKRKAEEEPPRIEGGCESGIGVSDWRVWEVIFGVWAGRLSEADLMLASSEVG